MKITKTNFFPIFLPHKHAFVILPEMREALLPCFKSIPTAEASYNYALDFLAESYSKPNNYDTYRNDLIVFFCWAYANGKDVVDITRTDMLAFIKFCNEPPRELQAKSARPVLIINKADEDDLRINPEWRPFKNANPDKPYTRMESTVQKQLSVLSSLFVYLNDVEHTTINPAALALRRFNPKSMDGVALTEQKEKALSQLQLSAMFDTLDELCIESENKLKAERARFLMYLLILAFPRRSEISATLRYSPLMSDFERVRVGDVVRYVFHIRKGKGSKSRKVLCSGLLIEALKRYRLFLGQSELPLPTDDSPLLVRLRAAPHGREAKVVDACISDKQLAEVVKWVFEETALRLDLMEEFEEAAHLRTLSAHSCRHTGISLALSAGRKPELLLHDTGHSTMASLMIYNSSRIEYRLGEVDKIDTVLMDYKL
ncbi:tyrosine-type recombinase/integrase [Vibrio agarivorans]|uniref:Site-specific integrase n=1 Tax=Vibrio agarivorans TaxID=153622 RepID=A0ABT7Y7C6_9VIBR|nr:site-specific integrase [Vibrio agarivorans]MDN2483902.1 site-specific integrase [Vibrio agarivorans]